MQADPGEAQPSAAPRTIRLAHSSDLHIQTLRDDPTGALKVVLKAAHESAADVVLLAGDVFDHNRLPLSLLDEVTTLLGDAKIPVVLLPGNHDCLTPDSVYRRGGLSEPDNVHIFGITVGETLDLPDLDLDIFGRAHPDYSDMTPLTNVPARRRRWQVAAAHGHWVADHRDHTRSWLIHAHDLEALDADYVALGHWDRPTPVGDGSIHAFYSGSPDLARTLNLVTFAENAGVTVQRVPLDPFHH